MKGTYKHNKTGNIYIVTETRLDCTNLNEGKISVCYESTTGYKYSREKNEFLEKFTKLSDTVVIDYKTRENSSIVIKLLLEPYGEGSEEVISIGTTLKGDIENPSWKVHIPRHLLSEVIKELELINK